MKIFVESIDRRIWDAIVNGLFVPKFEKDDIFIEKPWSQWTESESKRAQFDCIAKNIITYALNYDEFFRSLNVLQQKRCEIFLKLHMKEPLM